MVVEGSEEKEEESKRNRTKRQPAVQAYLRFESLQPVMDQRLSLLDDALDDGQVVVVVVVLHSVVRWDESARRSIHGCGPS